MDEMIALVLATVLLNGVFDAVVVAWLAGRRSQKALERWIRSAAEGDEKSQETLNQLAMFFLSWMGSAQIKTGRKVKVPDGEPDEKGNVGVREVDEVLTPMDLMSRTLSTYIINKFKGQAGGTKAQLGRILQEEAAELSPSGLSPAALLALSKGKLGPAIAEVGMPFLLNKLNKKPADIGSGGGQNW